MPKTTVLKLCELVLVYCYFIVFLLLLFVTSNSNLFGNANLVAVYFMWWEKGCCESNLELQLRWIVAAICSDVCFFRLARTHDLSSEPEQTSLVDNSRIRNDNILRQYFNIMFIPKTRWDVIYIYISRIVLPSSQTYSNRIESSHV